MLCSNVCSCGIVSSSLTITGSGQQGDPWSIETNAYQIVTSVTRPASPSVGQFIYETDTGRIREWDGTYWVIKGGAYPEVNCTQRLSDATTPVLTGSATDLILLNEVVDSDAFHTGTTGVYTIPAGYGGDYAVGAFTRWSADAAGYRVLFVNFASNTTTPLEIEQLASTLAPTVATTNSFQTVSGDVRLEAGATVTFQVYQTSGSTLSLTRTKAWLRMTNHLPALT